MSRSGRHHGHGGEIAAGIGLASLAGIAGGTYKFAEFLTKVKRLHDVASENAVFVRISQNVRSDLRETERLLALREVKDALRTNRAKVEWIRDTMARTRGVLEDMSKYTGKVEGDIDKRKGRWWTLGLGFGSGVGWRHRLRWVLDEHEKLDNRTTELGIVHQSLMEVVAFLGQFEPLACCAEEGHGRDSKEVRFDTRKEYIDEGYDEPRGRDTEVFRERTVYDERDRDVSVRRGRERDFVEGRKIELVDREYDTNASYGYGGGDGPRIADMRPARRAYDFDEEDDRTVYEKKTTRVYEEEPRHHDHHGDHHGHWVRKKVHVHHGPHGEVERDVTRVESAGHRGDHREHRHERHETDVYRERSEYEESDGGSVKLRTHWPSSRL